MSKTTQIKITGIAVLLFFVMVSVGFSETEDAGFGSLCVVNNYNAPVGAIVVYKGQDETGDSIVWKSSGVTIQAPENTLDEPNSMTFSDIPAGTWSVRVADRSINNVIISNGKTTTITRDSSGNLYMGYPQ